VATNQDLEAQVQSGSFRQDLYYRLNVVRIEIPPLRDRPVDITLLVNYYLDFYKKKYRKEVELDRDALARLNQHRWPGNVRELQNVIRRYVVLGLLEFDKNGFIATDLYESRAANQFQKEIPTHLDQGKVDFGTPQKQPAASEEISTDQGRGHPPRPGDNEMEQKQSLQTSQNKL
jgi:transcriptional regulator with PAS, ATPase and Fis domain